MTEVTTPTPRMRWWGWGVAGHDPEVSPALAALLREELGIDDRFQPPVALEEVRLPDAALPAEARQTLQRLVGDEHVRDDRLARVSHAVGRSYPDLVRIRGGDASTAPDAVVYPGSPEQVQALLEACAEARIAVVPFGGGTSVCGGVEGLRGPFASVVSVDLARLDSLTGVDRRSLSATVQAGMSGPALERALGEHELTLGHFPQSFEFTTVGGWVATRSAGQASTGYGRIDELVIGLRCATPAGEVSTLSLPASAAGPDLRELLVGSEGALGIITAATLRVRPRPAVKRYEAWSFRSWEEGAEAFRALEQAGAAPTVARLSDQDETRLSLALAGEGLAIRSLRRYLRARGHAGGCLAIIGWEGDSRGVRRARGRGARLLRRSGAVALGSRPGEAWAKARFEGPYLRDVLLARGVLVDTLETATTWSNLQGLYQAVRGAIHEALAARGTPAFVGCHISHLYPTGASLYFTFAARQDPGAELEQWHAAKTAAGDAIAAAGGTITHHHAVGRDHAPWLAPEIGRLGVELLRAAKATLDPTGIMNPGKLIDGAPLPGFGG